MNDMADNVKKTSNAGMIWGVIVLILGVLCISVPWVGGLGVVFMVGISLIAAGIAQGLFAFQSDSFGQGALRFVFSVLALVTGGWLLSKPGAGLASLTLFMAAWFFVDGIYSAIAAFQWKPQNGWGWMLFSGIISIVLGVMIYRQFPESAIWLLGVLVGIRLMFAGMTMIMLGTAGRQVAKAVDGAS